MIFVYLKNNIKKVIKKKCARSYSKPITLKTVLYLRTDICSQEITIGGSITHTLGVIQGFNHNNSKIICASSAMQSILSKINMAYFKPLKVPPLFCFLRWKFGYLRWHLDCFFSTFFFTSQIKQLFNLEIINAIYQRYSLLNFTGVLLSRLKKIPLILEYNGSEVWAYKNWGEKKFLNLFGLAKVIELINLHAAHTIIVVSQVLKDELITRDIDAQKIFVNPNGVDTEKFNPDNFVTQRVILHKKFAIENKFIFGFIGTFSYWHGIDVLAKMIPEIIQQHPYTHFMLIGDGVLKNFLEKELLKQRITSEHVTLTGAISYDKAKEFLALCDVFLSPTQPNSDGTRFFGSPTKIFEYLSMAKPVIASDLEQLSEILYPSFKPENFKNPLIIHDEIGVVIPPKNIQDFIDCSSIMVNLSKDNLKHMGLNARKKAIMNYTWDNHIKRIKYFAAQK